MATVKALITRFSIVAILTGTQHILEESQLKDCMQGLPPDLATKIMKPYGGEIEVWEVGRDVGNVRNNKPQLLDRVALI